MLYDEYKHDIFEAILRIREVEGDFVVVSVPIPNKVYEFLKYKDYPYDTPYIERDLFISSQLTAQKFLLNKLFEERINPYLCKYGALIK